MPSAAGGAPSGGRRSRPAAPRPALERAAIGGGGARGSPHRALTPRSPLANLRFRRLRRALSWNLAAGVERSLERLTAAVMRTRMSSAARPAENRIAVSRTPRNDVPAGSGQACTGVTPTPAQRASRLQ
jgi:hypothetical protein